MQTELKGRELALAFGLLMAGAYLLFANTFGNAWTYDDFPLILENPDIRSVEGFFRDTYFGRPLREITYLVDFSLFGVEPFGWHIQNVFWHGVNAFLVYVLVRRLGEHRPVAWIGSLLFLVHPVNVEVVASIAHRKDSLALAFSLMSLLAYIQMFRGRYNRRWSWFFAALALGGVALLAKENAAAILVLFLIYEAVFVSESERFLLRRKGVAAALAVVASGVLLIWFFFLGGREVYLESYPKMLYKVNQHVTPLAAYFRMVFKSWAFMISKVLFPADLALEYVYPVPQSWTSAWVLAGISGVGAYLSALAATWKKYPLTFLALAWFGIFWLPTSNLFPAAYFSADRYLYAPSVGLLLLAALPLGRAWPRYRIGVGLFCFLMLGFLMFVTWNQNTFWRTDYSLWTRAVEVSPTSSPALTGLGKVLMESGDLGRAAELFSRASMNMNFPLSYYYLARTYEAMGQTRNAIRYFCFYLQSKGEIISKDVNKDKIRSYLAEEYGVSCD